MTLAEAEVKFVGKIHIGRKGFGAFRRKRNDEGNVRRLRMKNG